MSLIPTFWAPIFFRFPSHVEWFALKNVQKDSSRKDHWHYSNEKSKIPVLRCFELSPWSKTQSRLYPAKGHILSTTTLVYSLSQGCFCISRRRSLLHIFNEDSTSMSFLPIITEFEDHFSIVNVLLTITLIIDLRFKINFPSLGSSSLLCSQD